MGTGNGNENMTGKVCLLSQSSMLKTLRAISLTTPFTKSVIQSVEKGIYLYFEIPNILLAGNLF